MGAKNILDAFIEIFGDALSFIEAPFDCAGFLFIVDGRPDAQVLSQGDAADTSSDTTFSDALLFGFLCLQFIPSLRESVIIIFSFQANCNTFFHLSREKFSPLFLFC